MIVIIKKYMFIIISVFLFIIVGIESLLLYKKYSNDYNTLETPLLSFNDEEKVSVDIDSIKVDIKGAVVNPGVYELDNGSIINDVIEKAGGFKSSAYKNNINLSKKLKDEMVIYVFTKSEYQKLNINTENNVSNTECNSYIDVSPCINEGSSIINTTDKEIVSDNNSNKTLNTKVNINNASKEELITLPGIGESKANSIIEYRNNNGLFKSIEDITNVTGIGQSMYDKIKDYITI